MPLTRTPDSEWCCRIEAATQAPSTGHTRASTKAGVAALFTSDVVFAKGAHLGAVDCRSPRTARPADLLCRGRGNRRCACWQSDPRRLASAPALSLALAEQAPVRTSAPLLDGTTTRSDASPDTWHPVPRHDVGRARAPARASSLSQRGRTSSVGDNKPELGDCQSGHEQPRRRRNARANTSAGQAGSSQEPGPPDVGRDSRRTLPGRSAGRPSRSRRSGASSP